MKKLLAVTLTLLMLFSCMSLSAFAADAASATVYVTIAGEEGNLVLTQETITVTDIDDDGALTINDALYAAHEASYEGGAAAGYASSHGAYGLSLDKLWGTEGGSSYGYYVNNGSAWSLTDPVKDGDHITAFVYTQSDWSDIYCYFDVATVETAAGKEITLTLSANSYDAQYNPLTIPVEGAVITLNGEKTAFKTDKDGKAAVTIDKEGAYIISAVSDTLTLVPPVCTAAVSANPATGAAVELSLALTLLAVSLSGVLLSAVMRKKAYEK